MDPRPPALARLVARLAADPATRDAQLGDLAEEFADLERFVQRLIALRAAHPVLWDPARWDDQLMVHGSSGGPDLSFESRSIAWSVDGLYVMANMWWEPVEFAIQQPGEWWVVVDTTDPWSPAVGARAHETVTVGPRSIVVLER